MKRKKYGFENISVASPCDQDWDSMTGDDQARFCGACERHVYNFTSMTGHEIAELLRSTEGRKCVRFYRREDGTILTADCPVGFRNARRRTMKRAAAFASLAFGGLFWGLSKQQDYAVMGEMVMGDVVMGVVAIAPEDVDVLDDQDR